MSRKGISAFFRLWRVRLLFLALGSIFGVIAAAAGLEVWLRAARRLELQYYSPGAHRGMGRKNNYRMAENLLLGWEHRNCAAGDPFGNNDPNYPIKKGPGVYRILVLGDSITAPRGGYVRHLGKLLGGIFRDVGFEVWNGGVGGYNLAQYYYNLRYKGFDLKPDLVIIGLCLNDLREENVLLNEKGRLQFLGAPSPPDSALDSNKTLLLHSYVYRYVRLALLGKTPAVLAGTTRTAPEKAFDMIVDETNQRGIRLFAVIIPYLKSIYRPREADEYAAIRRMLERRNVSYIDLHGAFQDVDDALWRENPDDDVHPSSKGHRVIAEKIYDYMAAHPALLNGDAR